MVVWWLVAAGRLVAAVVAVVAVVALSACSMVIAGLLVDRWLLVVGCWLYDDSSSDSYC